MSEPLRISVEIAEAIAPPEESSVKAATYWIDARVRPLVEALRAVTAHAESCEYQLECEFGDQRSIEKLRADGDLDESIVAARAALKDAGAE